MPLYYLIIFLVFGAVLYFLYCKGLAVTKCIAAVLFVFRPGRNTDLVKLGSCTGWVRHVACFHKDRAYEFSFESRLSQGDAEVSLLSKDKHPVLKLSKSFSNGRITLTENGRYYLRWAFQNATGQCELRWGEVEP